MPSFAEKVIAAHQAGVSERQAAERMQQESETHKLTIQQKKLELDALKLQSALHERSLQALQSGGPTGQATVQTPTIQPPAPAQPSPSDFVGPQPSAPQPQNIQDLLMSLRSKPVPFAGNPNMPIQGMSQSVETGTPPAFPDIPVQTSDGRTITIPGTNLEQMLTEKNKEAAAARALLPPAFGPAGSQPFIAQPSGGYAPEGPPVPKDSAKGLEMKEGTINGIPVMATFNPETGELKAGGLTVPPGLFKPKEATSDEAHNTITTDKGIFQYNPKTKKYDIPAGNAPAKDTSLAESNALERSYNSNFNRLNEVVKQIDPLAANIATAKELLAQNNPGANSLVAPAILKAVVGGQGSGIRITNAEIGQVNGGRGQIDNFQSWLTKWSLDPSKYQALLPDQKAWLNGVLDKIDQKIAAKQSAVSQAKQALIDATDAKTHKQVIKDMGDTLEKIDRGAFISIAAPAAGFKIVP